MERVLQRRPDQGRVVRGGREVFVDIALLVEGDGLEEDVSSAPAEARIGNQTLVEFPGFDCTVQSFVEDDDVMAVECFDNERDGILAMRFEVCDERFHPRCVLKVGRDCCIGRILCVRRITSSYDGWPTDQKWNQSQIHMHDGSPS